MQRNNARQHQWWLILIVLIGVGVLGFLGGARLGQPVQRLVLGANDTTPEPVSAGEQPDPDSSATREATAQPAFPTPTFVPVGAAPAVEPTAAEVEEPAIEPPQSVPSEPTSEPTSAPTAPPTRVPAPQPTRTPPPPAPLPAAPPIQASETGVRLDDSAWRGGYRNTRSYGGRSATWIYGSSTDYSAMRAVFNVDTQPTGAATLNIEGMDSEGPGKTPIRITINGTAIFTGANPLPDDDLPIESGTWTTVQFPFDAGLLQPGENTVVISNQSRGAFSLPPFFMLDYADVRFNQP